MLTSGIQRAVHAQLRWDPTRARRPACLVPLTTAYTPTRLAFCGVSVTLRTPYWECDRGYRHTQVMTTGIRVSSDSSLHISNNCAKLCKLATPRFLWVILNRPLWTSWTFWTSFGQCPNVQSSKLTRSLYSPAASYPRNFRI